MGSSWSVLVCAALQHLCENIGGQYTYKNIASKSDLHLLQCLACYSHCHCTYLQRKQGNVKKISVPIWLFPLHPSQTVEQHSTDASDLTLIAVKKWLPFPCRHSTQITSAYGNKANLTRYSHIHLTQSSACTK